MLEDVLEDCPSLSKATPSSCGQRYIEVSGKPHPRRVFRKSLLFLFLAMGSIFGTWASRIPDIKDTLLMSDGALGVVLFAAPVGEFFAVAVAAPVVRFFGSRLVILVSLAAYAFVLSCLSLAPSPFLLACILFCFGFASNVLNIALNAQAVDVERLYGRPIMASFHGMWSLGGVLGGLVGAILAPLGVSTFMHFSGITCVTLIVATCLHRRLLPHDLQREKTIERTKRTVRRFFPPSTFVILLGFIAFSNMATEGTMYDWSAVYFAQVIQPGEILVRAGYVSCMLAMVTGRFLTDRLTSRFGYVHVLQAGGLAIACGVSLACAVPSVWAATAGFAITGLGMSPAIPLCYSLTGRSRTVAPSVAISIISTISFFGILASPAGVGLLSHAFGLRFALLPLAVMGLSIVFLAPMLLRVRN